MDSRDALIAALEAAERDTAAFFASLPLDDFVRRTGTAWTPAEHLDHLNITNSTVARGFAVSRWFLRLRFGRARRASRTFEALRADYVSRLAAGSRAPAPFIPARAEPDAPARDAQRGALLARWQRVNGRLRTALQAWSERDLDRILLPHPILGKITAREMIFFAIYHAGHHVTAARRRLAGELPG